MTDLLLVSFIVPILKKVSTIKKDPQKYFSEIGSLKVCEKETTNHKISLVGKISIDKLYHGEPVRKAEKIFYRNNIKISFCDHGFLFVSKSVTEDEYSEIQNSLDSIWRKLEYKIKTIQVLYDPAYLQETRRMPPISLDSCTHYENREINHAFSSHIATRHHAIDRLIRDMVSDFTRRGVPERKFQRIDFLISLKEFVQAYNFKLSATGNQCDLISGPINEVKLAVKNILDKIDVGRNEIIRYLPVHGSKIRILEKQRLSGKKEMTRENKVELCELQFLFMDIEKYTGEGIDSDTQRKMIEKLNDVVSRSSKKAKLPIASCFINSTGDGMVIGVDKIDPRPILEFAINIQKSLSKYKPKNEINPKIRIGLEKGYVYSYKNIKGDLDYVGPGIIRAHRIMSFGSGGHILISKNVAAIKEMDPKYKKFIHKIEEPYKIRQEDEEGIEICNVYGKNFGNKLEPPHKALKS